MSKLTRAQSKTGKLLMYPNIMEGKEDDKSEEHGLRVDRGEDTPKKRRKVFKGKNTTPKGRKGPDRDSSKRGKRGKGH